MSKWQTRHVLDRSGAERIVIHFGDKHLLTVKVTRTRSWSVDGRHVSFLFDSNQARRDRRTLRRRLAHGRGGYSGEVACRVCRGRAPDVDDCSFCVAGIAKTVCGDCLEVLPCCYCMRPKTTPAKDCEMHTMLKETP